MSKVVQQLKSDCTTPGQLDFCMKISLVKGNFDILCPGVALGLRSCKKQQPAIPSYSNAKLKSGVFFNQKNKWNSSVNSNFENFEFWVLSILKFGPFWDHVPSISKIETCFRNSFYPGPQIQLQKKNFLHFQETQFSSPLRPSATPGHKISKFPFTRLIFMQKSN